MNTRSAAAARMCKRMRSVILFSVLLGISLRPAVASTVGERQWLVSGSLPDNPKWSFWSVLVDSGKQTLQVATKVGGGLLSEMADPSSDVAINGAYFLANYRPAGWLFDGKMLFGKPNPKSSGAVFYLKDGRAFIARLKSVPGKVDFAVQNSPVLVQSGAVIPKGLNNVRRAWRTVVCLPSGDTTGRLVRFIIIKSLLGEGPTLHETAEILARPQKNDGFACRQALNLDGGKSSGIIFPRHDDLKSSPPGVPIGHGLTIQGF